MLTGKLPRISLAHLSLTLVGLMWVLPFLHSRHQYPLTTFYQEWWSALLGVLALILLATRDYWQQPQIPRIVQLPAGLIAVLLLQSGFGKVAYFEQALLYVLYLLFAALLMMLGARLRDCFGIGKLAITLAICLSIGAELSALTGVLQHYRWHTPLDQFIAVKVSFSVFGNLAQPNHFANYTALGLVSLGLLYQQRRLKMVYVAALAAPLLFVMTLSGSRSSWLYLLMMTGLAWWGMRRDAAQRPLLHYSLLLMAGFALMHGIVQLPFMAGAGIGYDVMHRMFADSASGGIRLYLWHEAWLMFAQSPWLGVGFGQFAWHHFQLLPVLQQGNMAGLYNNAHNLIFQLAAEAGVPGLLILLTSLGIWLNGLRRATPDAAHWWGYAVFGVLAIHSLLEYPLWYSYFVAVAAFVLGALDETHYRLELRNAGRMSLVAITLMGLMTLVQLRSDYRQLERTLVIRPASAAYENLFGLKLDNLVALQGGSLLLPYAELYMSTLIEIGEKHLREKLELNTRVMHFAPIGKVVYRQVLLLAQAGRQEDARALLEQAVWSYPGDLPGARQQMKELTEKDPEHFSALLEFALQKEQEYPRAVHNQ